MKKTILLVLVLALCFALPTFAQDEGKKESAPQEMGPPPALDNELMKAFVGEWEGKTEGGMGISEDKVSYKMGMDGQFLMVEIQSKKP